MRIIVFFKLLLSLNFAESQDHGFKIEPIPITDVNLFDQYWAPSIPGSWRIMYLDGGDWKPILNPIGYLILKVEFSRAHFEPVRTKALRLEFTSQKGVSTDVHEWIIE